MCGYGLTRGIQSERAHPKTISQKTCHIYSTYYTSLFQYRLLLLLLLLIILLRLSREQQSPVKKVKAIIHHQRASISSLLGNCELKEDTLGAGASCCIIHQLLYLVSSNTYLLLDIPLLWCVIKSTLFRQLTTFIKVCVAFVFGLQTLYLIDFKKIIN